jgi:hypothetical protein
MNCVNAADLLTSAILYPAKTLRADIKELALIHILFSQLVTERMEELPFVFLAANWITF